MANKYREDFFKSIRNKKFNTDLFLDMAEDIIKERELTSYIKGITLTNKECQDNGSYRPDGMIRIGLKRSYAPNLPYYYYDIFSILFHELCHAEQKKLLAKNKEYYSKLPLDHIYTNKEMKEIIRIVAIGKSWNYARNNKEVYSKKHNCFSLEHEAIYRSFVDTTAYMQKLVPEIELPESYNKAKIQLLLSEYDYNKNYKLFRKVVSPVEKVLFDNVDKRTKKLLSRKDILNLEERMVLGLPITSTEMNKVLRKYKD